MSCILVNFIAGRMPRRLLIFISFLLLTVSNIFQGPSDFLGLPDNLTLLVLGYALDGLAQGFIFIPLLPDAIEAVYIKEEIFEGANEELDIVISDYGAGLYGTFYSLG